MIITFSLDHSFKKSEDFFAEGTSFCPKGTFSIRIYIKKRTNINKKLTTFKLSFTQTNQTEHKELNIEIHGFPIAIKIFMDDSEAEEIAVFPKMKGGEGFDLDLFCDQNDLEILINKKKIHTSSILHELYPNPVFTHFDGIQDDKNYAMITNIYHTYCRCAKSHF